MLLLLLGKIRPCGHRQILVHFGRSRTNYHQIHQSTPPPTYFDASALSSTSTSNLSDNYVHRVYQRLVNCGHDEEFDPVLHVRVVTTKYRTPRLQSNGGNEYVTKQVTFNDADNQDNIVTIKITTQMN